MRLIIYIYILCLFVIVPLCKLNVGLLGSLKSLVKELDFILSASGGL